MGTINRREYLTATVLDQAFLDRCQDNLDNGIEMIVDIETPSATIKASDQNKYVGGSFYEALTTFPLIRRSIGEWLNPEIEFSRLTISISNVDGRFNRLNPGGADFAGWIGRSVTVKLGLRDIESTYKTIYSGKVTSIGGFQRDRAKFTLVTRDKMDELNKNFPSQALTKANYPLISDSVAGKLLPVIYGDWTVNVTENGASVPAFIVNGGSGAVIAGTGDLEAVISENDNDYIDTSNVFIKRGDLFYRVPTGDITVGAGNRSLTIRQPGGGGGLTIDGAPYVYSDGDMIYLKMRGKSLGAYSDNLIAQAQDILTVYGGADPASFAANWNTYRDKATPAESAVTSIKSRVWVQEQKGAVQYALSMLEQVRIEMFQDRDLKLKLFALHLEEFDPAPSYKLTNWDLESGTLTPQIDERNIWNRARADFAFDPSLNENSRQTPLFKNQAAIDQVGREISKKVVFPNLYIEADVTQQLKEMLKLASGYSEFIEATLTPRSLLKDIGEFVSLNMQFGAIIYENVPAIIRDIGYDSRGLRIPVRLWCLQMLPFPGYTPGNPGTVGGSTAVITEET